MKVAVLRFPGSNCDQDALHAINDDLGVHTEYVWQDETSLAGYDAVCIPGGFTFGDYLRCGAMASRASIMPEVARFAKEGKLVIGICNGFQILCEAGLLPGALMRNEQQKFSCKHVYLKAVNHSSPWTQGVKKVLEIPIAHGEGRYVCDEPTLKQLQDSDRIAFQYVTPEGQVTRESNPNGSVDNIAGIVNQNGNVLGLMPHPERATKAILGSTDGRQILQALTLVTANR